MAGLFFRTGLRAFSRRAPSTTTATAGTGFTFRAGAQRRATSSSAQQPQQQAESWFARMWNSPVGFKTVHFWWVLAGCWRGGRKKCRRWGC
jgi:hypothetical protein